MRAIDNNWNNFQIVTRKGFDDHGVNNQSVIKNVSQLNISLDFNDTNPIFSVVDASKTSKLEYMNVELLNDSFPDETIIKEFVYRYVSCWFYNEGKTKKIVDHITCGVHQSIVDDPLLIAYSMSTDKYSYGATEFFYIYQRNYNSQYQKAYRISFEYKSQFQRIVQKIVESEPVEYVLANESSGECTIVYENKTKKPFNVYLDNGAITHTSTKGSVLKNTMVLARRHEKPGMLIYNEAIANESRNLFSWLYHRFNS